MPTSTANDDPLRPHRILISFHYARGKNLGEEGKKWWPHFPVRIFGDSGAYSALTQGAPIDIGEYAEWLRENLPHLTVYANLDAIGDHQKSAANLAELERRGFAPIPVFHMGSPFAELERLIDAGYPYIALGGLVGGATDVLMRFAIACFKIARAKGRGTVFHGFGLTNLPAVMGLPWYSVDSSSWGQAYRFGTLKLFDPPRGTFVTVRLFSDDVNKHARLLRSYGAEPERLIDRKRYHHSDVAGISALSWRALETWCRRRHGAIPFPGDRDGPHHYQVVQPKEASRTRAVNEGLHLYLATKAGATHGPYNQAITKALADRAEGLHLYMADSNTQNLGFANKGVMRAVRKPKDAG